MRDPEWLQEVRWNDAGLVPAVVQDDTSGEVLMMAWMNREALCLTLTEARTVFWSRSRARLWRKGESSGHVQRLRELRIDCDGDTLLLRVEQVGGIACHTGRRSCFFRRHEDGRLVETEAELREPRDVDAPD